MAKCCVRLQRLSVVLMEINPYPAKVENIVRS